MQALLPRRAQAVGRCHGRGFAQQNRDVAVRQKQKTRDELRHMQLPQRRAQYVDSRRGDEQKRHHERKHALHHQRQHGDTAAGDGNAAEIQIRRAVKKRVRKTDRAHQRQHHAQLVKAVADAKSCQLERQHGVEQHHNQPRQVVFWERHDKRDICRGDCEL